MTKLLGALVTLILRECHNWIRYERSKRLTPMRTSKCLPITPGILCQLKAVWKKETNRRNAKMLWAAACLCFFGFLRSGEAVAPSERNYDPNHHLCFEDVCIDDPKSPAWIQVTMKSSKTDHFRDRE